MASAKWYAAKTKSGQDRTACEHLRRQHFELYYPQITIERWKSGSIREEREALFPGYVLIRIIDLEPRLWRVINSTRGIYRLLSFSEDGLPSSLPHGEIERLQQREREGKLYISEIVRLRRGDRIRLKVGPSVDQIGEVVRTRGERVEFLLKLLGRKVRCIAPEHALELVSDRASRSVR